MTAEFIQFIETNEQSLRLGVFLGLLLVMALWELWQPRRVNRVSKLWRWVNNLSLVFVNTFIARLVLPIATTAVALWASEQNIGLFNWLDIGFWPAFLISLVLFDLLIYWQHRLFHTVPILWRLHRVHHADKDFDVTTAGRFHTIEILLSLLIKFVAILLMGPSVAAVIVFEMLLNGFAMFNHGNVRLPVGLDALLRKLIVTSDMHRVHHSTAFNEHNSNYGFNLSIWDRVFKSYVAKAKLAQPEMRIGLTQFKQNKWVMWLPGLLAMPFLPHQSEAKNEADD